MKYLFLLLLFLLLQLPKTVSGQENRVFWNYDISHGLLTNSNYSLMVDHHGRLWFGSDKGVTCYNGNSFKTYTVSDGLSDNTIIRCFEDSKGRIWFLHVNRLPSYLYKNKIHRLNNIQGEISIDQTSELLEIDSNTFLIGGKNGFYKIRLSGKIQRITDRLGHNSGTHSLTNGKLVISHHTNTVVRHLGPIEANLIDLNDHFKTYSVIEAGAFFRSFDYFYSRGVISSKALREWKSPVNDKSAFVFEIIEKDNQLFISTSNGLKIYSRNNADWVENETLLPGEEVISSRHDKQGGLWIISKNNGVYFFPKLKFSYYPCPITDGYFTSINKSEKSIFLGTNNSKVFVFKENKFSLVKNYTSYAKLPINITSFHQYKGYDIVNANAGTYLEKNGHVWALDGSYNSVFYRDSNFILGPCLYGVQRINLNTEKPTKQMLYLTLGRTRKLVLFKDCIIAGCQNGIWEIRNEQLTPLDKGKLATARINGLEKINRVLFIGTANDGLWTYVGNTLQKYEPAEAILSDAILGMYPGENKTLWVHSASGLQHFKWTGKKLVELHRLDLKTNFKSDELIGMLEIKGHLVLLTHSGLIDLELKNIPPVHKIKLFIDRFEINHAPYSLKQMKFLQRNFNNLSFALGSVNFSAHPLVFYYRINKGKWIQNGSEVFTFSSLQPGDYDIEFMVENPIYEASYLKIPTFTIQKKWWQKTIYIVIISFCVVLFLVFIIFWRISKIQSRKQRFLSIELMALQSQMNPHFTFNSLNSIQSYLSSNDKRSAQIYLADFAILIRKILEQGKLHLISLEEEIEFLSQYLELEKRRLNNSFNYTIQVDDELNAQLIAIPTLMLQPFIENAIWHGVAGLDYKGKIEIRFSRQSDAIVCEIIDNGKGWGNSSEKISGNTSTGIENCRERMSLFKELYKKELSLEIIDRKNTKTEGVCIRMTIPVLINHNA